MTLKGHNWGELGICKKCGKLHIHPMKGKTYKEIYGSEENATKEKNKRDLKRRGKKANDIYKNPVEWKRKISETLKKKYANGEIDRFEITKKAHEKVNLLIQEGKFVLQKLRFDQRIVKPTKPQVLLFNKIKQHFPDAELEYKIEEIKRSCDIGLPSLKIDIEYDEPYWHKNHEQDRKRDLQFSSIGWKVIRLKPSDLSNFKIEQIGVWL